METSFEAELLEQAVRTSCETEAARVAMMEAAARRHEAIFGLHATGLSIRAIAQKLDCSPSVVQVAVKRAVSLRPAIERRENRVTYELHRELAEKLEQNPSFVVSKGLENISKMLRKKRDPLSKNWVLRWQTLLQGNLDEMKRFMLEISHDAEDMRQMSPFMGVLTNEERLLAIKKAGKYAA